MVNVGFGDCFVINNQKEYLLVDCGTVSFAGNNNLFYDFDDLVNFIGTLIPKRNCSSVITHFHEDHYRGFKILADNHNNIFETTYIPNLFICNDGRPVLLELAIYLYMFLDRTIMSYVVSENILQHIEMVTKLTKNNNIHSVSQGKIINLGYIDFDVLWPKLDFDDWSYSIMDILRELDSYTENNAQFKKAKDNLLANMKKWYEITDEKNLKNNKEFDRIIKLQRKYLKQLNKIKKDDINFKDASSVVKHHFTSVFSKSNNSASIVFQNCDKKILMMGDIEKRIIAGEIQPYFIDDLYNIVKVPHHGTHSHYCSSIPNSEVYLIPTGAHGNHGKISESYRTHKGCAGKRICSCGIRQCDIRANNHQCIHGKCYGEFDFVAVR